MLAALHDFSMKFQPLLKNHPFRALHSGWAAVGFGLIVAALTFYPIVELFVDHIQMFDIATEFVAYRVGDALSIMFHDSQNVHPVQGSTHRAALQADRTRAHKVYDARLLNPDVLQLYSEIWFATVFIITTVIVAWQWRVLSWPERLGLAILAITPWYMVISQLFAPEYWCGEWAWLVSTTAIIPGVTRNGGMQSHKNRLAFLFGLWFGALVWPSKSR